jgi:hypothetical protein
VETSYLTFEPGLRIAARSGYKSWYGVIDRVTRTCVVVVFEDGRAERFSRNSRFQVGSEESRYTRPYLCTVAEARRRDEEYRAATERARLSLQLEEGTDAGSHRGRVESVSGLREGRGPDTRGAPPVAGDLGEGDDPSAPATDRLLHQQPAPDRLHGALSQGDPPVITRLQERHRPLFATLTPPEVEYVWDQVTNKWRNDTEKLERPSTADALFNTCRDAGLDHARVVLSFAGENGDARPIIEKLVGRAIVPWGPTVEAAQAEAAVARASGRPSLPGSPPVPRSPTTGPAKRSDTRIVAWVRDTNPHRAGCEMAISFDKWRVGETVQQCRDRGVSARNVRRDVRHGHVRLEGVKP